jgi:inorganic triphosphatase YgiF
MHDILERLDKFDVDDRFVLPKLDDIVVNGEVQHDTVDVTNACYDTSDHDLQAQGIVLRSRDGDGETGWQLEIPVTDRRTELHWLLSDDPPAEVTTLLTGVTLGKRESPASPRFAPCVSAIESVRRKGGDVRRSRRRSCSSVGR